MDSGIDDMSYAGGQFNGLHAYGSIGTASSYGLVQSGRGGDPAQLVSTMTHEEGHGVGMRHDHKGLSDEQTVIRHIYSL